jgi:hypothetical protein
MVTPAALACSARTVAIAIVPLVITEVVSVTVRFSVVNMAVAGPGWLTLTRGGRLAGALSCLWPR